MMGEKDDYQAAVEFIKANNVKVEELSDVI